jgi:hypothetical protein
MSGVDVAVVRIVGGYRGPGTTVSTPCAKQRCPHCGVSGKQAPDADLMERSTVPAGIAVLAHTPSGGTIHHSDAGSKYTATHFADTLMLAGLTPSVGTVGDALDNALAVTTSVISRVVRS